MKHFIFFLLLCISSNGLTHDNPVSEKDYVHFVQENGFWALIQETDKLVFCFGLDQEGKPACTNVPKQYIVIELPKNLQ